MLDRIRTTFHNLVVAKIQQYRKKYHRVSQEPEEAYDKSSSTLPNTTRPKSLRVQLQLLPHASSARQSGTLLCTAPASREHTDAARLEEHGIWLGDASDDDAAVNGLPFNAIADKVFCHGMDNLTFHRSHSTTRKSYMHCAACYNPAGLTTDTRLQISWRKVGCGAQTVRRGIAYPSVKLVCDVTLQSIWH